MRSPFTARGTFSVATPDDGGAARIMAFQLSRSLNPLHAREVEVSDDRVTCRGAVLRAVWGWSLLGPIDWIRVVLRTTGETVQVDYELRLVELPLLALALSSVLAVPTLVFGELATGIGAFLVFCVFFVGTNHRLTHWRFQRFLQRALRRANRRTMPPS